MLVSNIANLTDGDPDTSAGLFGSDNGVDSSLVVNVSSFNPITSIQIKDYGDGPTWDAYRPNEKGEWLAFNGAY